MKLDMTENGMEGLVVTSIMPFLKVRLISMALIVSPVTVSAP